MASSDRSVIISGLPPTTKLAELRKHFERIGEVVALNLVGEGPELVCEYLEASAAKEAAKILNGTEYEETRMTVKHDGGSPKGTSKKNKTSNVMEEAMEMLRSQGFIIQSPCKTGGINTVPPASHQPAPATYVPPPRISPFSGDKVTKVGEVAFESWVYEVKCLRRGGYSEATLAPIVRRSLRGEAAQLTMRLGLDASIEEILKKLEGRYGTVESGASLLQQFYNTKQLANETVAEFGNRLEVSIRKAQERGGILQAAVDEALRVVFWMGLQNDKVKVAIRHQKDSVPDFDALIRLARIAEQEDTEHAKQTPKEARVSQQAAVEVPSALDEVERLKAQVAELSRQLQLSRMPPVYSQPPPGNLLQARSDQRKCYRCLNYGHIARECKNEVTCLRCGKSGHIASRCNEPLNQNGPLPEGGR